VRKRVTPVAEEPAPDDVGVPSSTASEDDLIRRATADRGAGRDSAGDIEELVRLAANRNQAALDRLAK
jgi:hypothetical protein